MQVWFNNATFAFKIFPKLIGAKIYLSSNMTSTFILLETHT